MIRQSVTIVCAAFGLSAAAQTADTICLPRAEVIAQVNAHAACDSSVVFMTELMNVKEARIAELEESRSELIMQVDLHKRVRVNIEAESAVLRDDLKAAQSEVKRAKLVTRIVFAVATVAQITTIYLFVR